MRPEDILETYARHGPAWAERRDRSLFEAAHLDRFLTAAPGPRILDLGCGSGQPVAAYLAARGAEVTGVDGAAPMVALFRQALPDAVALTLDMRRLALPERFDGILAWDSFFHLSPGDQRAMMGVFAAHAAPGAALCLTVGPEAGERIGAVEGAAVYHASLSPEGYDAALAAAGFTMTGFWPEDPDCGGHTVLHARYFAC